MVEGILAVGNSNFGQINQYDNTRTVSGYTLHECVDTQPAQTTISSIGSGLSVQTGRAVYQTVETVSETYVQNGNINTRNVDEKMTNVTEFVICPDHFVLVENTSGRFFYEDIMQANTSCKFSRPNIDLDSYAKTRKSAKPWKFGFDNTGQQAEKGTVYGDDVTSDPDMGTVLKKSNKNQLGLEMTYKGKSVKMQVSSNGYVQVSKPSFNYSQFAEFIVNEIEPHW